MDILVLVHQAILVFQATAALAASLAHLVIQVLVYLVTVVSADILEFPDIAVSVGILVLV